MADGSIRLRDAPPGAVPLMADEVDRSFGTAPVTLHVLLPDGLQGRRGDRSGTAGRETGPCRARFVNWGPISAGPAYSSLR